MSPKQRLGGGGLVRGRVDLGLWQGVGNQGTGQGRMLHWLGAAQTLPCRCWCKIEAAMLLSAWSCGIGPPQNQCRRPVVAIASLVLLQQHSFQKRIAQQAAMMYATNPKMRSLSSSEVQMPPCRARLPVSVVQVCVCVCVCSGRT